jgi:tetratricopeptide (TPR) repeat protein
MRRDHRRAGALITLLAVWLGGLLISLRSGEPPAGDESRRHFDEAVLMLHARQFEPAVAALRRVLALQPKLPEAHVNMGFALLGLHRAEEARAHFDSATALRPDQANAYYGLALAHEALGDLPMATGAMRSYLHLARNERDEHLRRARAALWEWEQARPVATRR